MENIEELVRNRRSVRTFDGKEISPEDMEKLTTFMSDLKNPYGIPVICRLLDAKQQKLSCPVVSGTDLYLGVKAKRVPNADVAVGYSLEMLVLYAQSIGIGTVWVGGTMDRAAFERAMELDADEMMPCMSPLGYPSKKMSIKESMMRKGVKADSRNSFETMFFDGDLNTPLTPEKAGKLEYPLEMVRWAPSAVNKQPWRIVVNQNDVHFYLKHSRGFGSKSSGDMQKVDMGIALCHFSLAAEERGLNIKFCISDPEISTEADTEYIATYTIPESKH
ncbi:MAG: nitroreductase family protein [Oscillospiraceae bacterium]|nr:nitroreductase family protein [Oscillospiraceae bacterium]